VYNPVATFCPASIDACGSWRMFYPKLYIPGARFLFTEGPPPLNDLSEADVAVVQRMMVDGNIRWIEIVRSLGIKLIYDLDDNLWQMSSYNLSKRIFGKKETLKGLEACAEWADVFTVSTNTLRKVVDRQWGGLRNVATKKRIPVMTCENRVPLPLYCKQEGISHEHEGVIIGFAGSNTHTGDMMFIWDLLHKMLDEYPQVRVEVVGQPPPKYFFNHPRVKVKPWVHISEYPARTATWNWDIILAPLEDHKFNLSKSSIRMQEAGALQRPCLASSYGPYDEFVEKAKPELKWLLCIGSAQWERKLRALIESEELRKEMGQLMYDNVVNNFRIEQSVAEWQEAIHVAYHA